jgi:hypothetical protein
MPFSGMLRRMTPVITYVSQDCVAFIVRMIRIIDLGKTLAVNSNRGYC